MIEPWTHTVGNISLSTWSPAHQKKVKECGIHRGGDPPSPTVLPHRIDSVRLSSVDFCGTRSPTCHISSPHTGAQHEPAGEENKHAQSNVHLTNRETREQWSDSQDNKKGWSHRLTNGKRCENRYPRSQCTQNNVMVHLPRAG